MTIPIRQLPRQRSAFVRVQIEGNALFIAPQAAPPERGAVVQEAPDAERITLARRFNLDHLRPEISHDTAGKWPGK